VADEHLATEITLGQMQRLRERLAPGPRPGGQAIVACVEGEGHAIGARMLADLVDLAARRRPDLVALSVTRPEHLPAVSAVAAGLRRLSPAPRILAGGAALRGRPRAAAALGVDGVAADALSGMHEARRLVAGVPAAAATGEDYFQRLGRRVQALRSDRGWTQQQLAEAAGLDGAGGAAGPARHPRPRGRRRGGVGRGPGRGGARRPPPIVVTGAGRSFPLCPHKGRRPRLDRPIGRVYRKGQGPWRPNPGRAEAAMRQVAAILAACAFLLSTVVPGAGQVTYYCDGRAATIVGTPGNDLIRGTPGDDVIVALDGHDKIYPYAGHDVVCAGAGNDTVYGGTGNDRLFGDAGDDFLAGQDGDNFLDGGDGNDRLYGDSGNDTLLGGGGRDLLSGKAGDDLLDGGDDIDKLYGGAGHDVILGGNGNDFLDGDDGDDVLAGGEGDDRLYGAGGNDTLDGGAGENLVSGGTGTDQCTNGPLFYKCETIS
jgi:hypothetical protein